MSICIAILRGETLARWRPSGIGSKDMTDGSGAKLVTQIAGCLMVQERRLMWGETEWQTWLVTFRGGSIVSIRQLSDENLRAQW